MCSALCSIQHVAHPYPGIVLPRCHDFSGVRTGMLSAGELGILLLTNPQTSNGALSNQASMPVRDGRAEKAHGHTTEIRQAL